VFKEAMGSGRLKDRVENVEKNIKRKGNNRVTTYDDGGKVTRENVVSSSG